MATCGRTWCERELHIRLDDGVVVRHRGTISRCTVGPTKVLVTVTVLGDRAPVIGIETADRDGGPLTTPLASLKAADAWNLFRGVSDMVERIMTDVATDRDAEPDFGQTFREQAEKEREKYGPYLWMGPFEESPYGLADQITEHFTATEGTTDRGTSWLLGVLATRNIETGEADRSIAREIVDEFGPDAAQVIGGWVFRAA